MSKTTNKLSPKVRDHAVRLVLDKITVPGGDVDFREDWLRAANAANVTGRKSGFGISHACTTGLYPTMLLAWKRQQRPYLSGAG